MPQGATMAYHPALLDVLRALELTPSMSAKGRGLTERVGDLLEVSFQHWQFKHESWKSAALAYFRGQRAPPDGYCQRALEAIAAARLLEQ